MIDLDIKYPGEIDTLPVTTEVSVNLGENINALRESILNLQQILGLNVNIGLFTPTPEEATVAGRLKRLERGLAERNLVYREINVSDSLSVFLNQNNQPFVKIGRGEANNVSPVTIAGPLTILSPYVASPETLIQTPVRVDVTTFNEEASTKSLFKGKSNIDNPLLTITDTNEESFIRNNTSSYALKVEGNMVVTGTLQAEYSIDHNQLLNIETIPTEKTRGETRHVTMGDYHSHRKGRYDQSAGKWIVDSSTNSEDTGIINHRDLEGIGTLPTHGNDFTPLPNTAYHVTGGDLHSHKDGDGAQIDHNDLRNVNPKFSNHVTGGDSHDHADGRGAQIDHSNLSNIGTGGENDIHVPKGGNHRHEVDDEGNPLGDGSQINHSWLSNIETTGEGALHVTSGDAHAHTSAGDGGTIDHGDLSNAGTLTHSEIDQRIGTFRRIKTGITSFTNTNFDEVDIQHQMGTSQFNLHWSIASINSAPPSDPSNIGVIYVDSASKNSTTVTLKRIGGAAVGPAIKATYTTSFGGNKDLEFIAREAGTDGNNIELLFRDEPTSLTGSDVLKVIAVTSPESITVIFDSGASSGITANDAKAAILADPAASQIVDVINASGSNGTGNIEELDDGYGNAVTLSGGQDSSGFTSLDLEWTAIATV